MSVRKRSRLQIITNVLEVASQPLGVGKTYIMFQANLSNELMQEYLNFLVEKKLLDVWVKSARRRLFKTNDRGLEYIRKFRELEVILGL